ncbi:hypothetical protein GEMRC1_009535 [Eukaryota sp. GEM-RC1]
MSSSDNSSSENSENSQYSASDDELSASPSSSVASFPREIKENKQYEVCVHNIGSSHVSVLTQTNDSLQLRLGNIPPDSDIVLTISNKTVTVTASPSSAPPPSIATPTAEAKVPHVGVSNWDQWTDTVEPNSQSIADRISSIFGSYKV